MRASQTYAVRREPARSILTKTSGFIAQAGFTHSLTPARNCTYGCSYCYVPTLRIYGGLRPDDWRRWGQATTFKSNAADLLGRAIRPHQRIYCSPLVDPYQPAEEAENLMPAVLDVLLQHPPKVFVIQTRGPLIVRDLAKLVQLHHRTRLRISFSLTTNRDDVRKLYEPWCATIKERLQAIRTLRRSSLAVYATLAPLLPCDPEELARLALANTDRDIVGDPFHVRSVKRYGATTRSAAYRISEVQGLSEWHNPEYQQRIAERIRAVVEAAGRRFGVGPKAFAWLAANKPSA